LPVDEFNNIRAFSTVNAQSTTVLAGCTTASPAASKY
jgi:hypothetical protein